MDGQHRDGSLIEHILPLLNHFQSGGFDLDCFADGQGEPEDVPGAQTACELIRFMDEMPGGFLLYRADGDEEIIYANRALLRIFQCGSMREFREMTGNSFRGLVHPDDLEEVERSIAEQIAASHYDLDYVEYRIIRKDGAIRWIEDYGHFVRSKSAGNVFYVFLGDATEKRARRLDERAMQEQKLRELIKKYDKERSLINQEHLRRLEVIKGLSVNYESILYADLDRDSILAYRLSTRTVLQFQEKYQLKPLSWYVDDYVRTWVHPEDREQVARATAPQYMREKLAESSTYYINYRAIEDGKTEYLQLRIVDVSRGERISQAVLGYRRMDAELQQEMEQKQLLADALNNANLAITAKNVFLSNMSHDMRTPLNAIFGFTTLARMHSGDPAAVEEYLGRIETSSRQLLDLIDKVLEIAWTESREVHLEDDACDLSEIMGEIYEFLLPHAQEKDIELSLDCSQLAQPQIYGDEGKLKQLVLYLANNAVTYTKPGGRISLAAMQPETLNNQYAVYQIQVSDTGIGISQEFLSRIFDPFTREKNTTLSGVHGTGLGLTIAKNLVDMLGGTIQAQSVLDEGSTFTVTLRLRTRTPGPVSTAAGANGSQQQGRRILLVEDNEINLEIETEILEELGFSIETAEDGDIAVRRMSSAAPGEFDLILMDIQMPTMDGWQAAAAIRALEDPALAGIPIIALSANVFDSDVQRSIKCGMDAHLTKPIDVPVLLETIEQVIQKHSRHP